MSVGIANAIRGAAAGGAVGAAAGGAAAYGAFAAVAMFGSASTGAAISTLSGVAATNATLAVLGGGTLAAGGAGMAGGALLLTGMVAAPAAALAGRGILRLETASQQEGGGAVTNRGRGCRGGSGSVSARLRRDDRRAGSRRGHHGIRQHPRHPRPREVEEKPAAGTPGLGIARARWAGAVQGVPKRWRDASSP